MSMFFRKINPTRFLACVALFCAFGPKVCCAEEILIRFQEKGGVEATNIQLKLPTTGDVSRQLGFDDLHNGWSDNEERISIELLNKNDSNNKTVALRVIYDLELSSDGDESLSLKKDIRSEWKSMRQTKSFHFGDVGLDDQDLKPKQTLKRTQITSLAFRAVEGKSIAAKKEWLSSAKKCERDLLETGSSAICEYGLAGVQFLITTRITGKADTQQTITVNVEQGC